MAFVDTGLPVDVLMAISANSRTIVLKEKVHPLELLTWQLITRLLIGLHENVQRAKAKAAQEVVIPDPTVIQDRIGIVVVTITTVAVASIGMMVASDRMAPPPATSVKVDPGIQVPSHALDPNPDTLAVQGAAIENHLVAIVVIVIGLTTVIVDPITPHLSQSVAAAVIVVDVATVSAVYAERLHTEDFSNLC